MKALFPLLLALLAIPAAHAGHRHHDEKLIIIYRDDYRPYRHWCHHRYHRHHHRRCDICAYPRFHRHPRYDIRLYLDFD